MAMLVDEQALFDVVQKEIQEAYNFGVMMGNARTKNTAISAHIYKMSHEEFQEHVSKRIRQSINNIVDLVDLEIADPEQEGDDA